MLDMTKEGTRHDIKKLRGENAEKNGKFLQFSKILPIFAVENDCEVRLHLGNEQARCSRFALTLAAKKNGMSYGGYG